MCANQSAPTMPFRKAKKFMNQSNLCTQCVGHYDEPQCQQVCPVDCILIDEEHPESHDELMAKYYKIVAEK